MFRSSAIEGKVVDEIKPPSDRHEADGGFSDCDFSVGGLLKGGSFRGGSSRGGPVLGRSALGLLAAASVGMLLSVVPSSAVDAKNPVMFAAGNFWQDETPDKGTEGEPQTQDPAPDESSDKSKAQDEAAAQEEAAAEDGAADFEKATALKISANRLRDLDKVVQLCESALKKGLDADSEKFCRQMMLDSLMEYANQMSARILAPARDANWQFMRQEALKRLEKAVAAKDDLRAAWLLIAKLNVLERGDRAAGLNAVAKLIDLAADDKRQLSETLLVRAGYAENDEDRLEDLNQAVEVDPTHVEALRTRGLYFYLKDESEKAVADFRKLLEVDSSDVASGILLAESLIQTKDYDEALKLLDEMQAEPGDDRITLLKAQVYFSQENYDKSLENATKALENNEDNLQAINLKILSLLQLDRFEEASQEANDLVRRAPGLPQAYWLRSIALSSMDKFDEAIADLKILVDNVPENPLYRLQLGNLYNASDRPRRAIEVYDDLISEVPELEGLYRSRGDAYLAIGKHKEAIADYEKELKQSPEDSGTLNNLAWVLSTSPEDDLRDGQKAIELATKSCELTEFKQPHILSTLASSYAEAGDFAKALEWIEKALKLAEETNSKNLEDIKKELEAYKKNEKWREKEDTAEAPLSSDDGGSLKDKKKAESKSEDDDF